MLLEDVPVGMSEQDNELIKHYTFDNKNDSNVFHLDIAYCITNTIGRIGKETLLMSGRRFITLKKHIYLKCHMHQSILCLILIFQILVLKKLALL